MKSVLGEIALICLVAAAIGLAWNHSMLLNAWTGKPVTGEVAAPANGGTAVPLPLGLMQVKDFFDRRDAVFVDARDRDTFTRGHVKTAVSLPLAEAERAIAGLLKTVPVAMPLVIYCNGFDCHDSKTLAELLLKAGYQTVFIFEGGFPEWRDAGYPVEGSDHGR